MVQESVTQDAFFGATDLGWQEKGNDVDKLRHVDEEVKEAVAGARSEEGGDGGVGAVELVGIVMTLEEEAAAVLAPQILFRGVDLKRTKGFYSSTDAF